MKKREIEGNGEVRGTNGTDQSTTKLKRVQKTPKRENKKIYINIGGSGDVMEQPPAKKMHTEALSLDEAWWPLLAQTPFLVPTH